MHVTKQRLVCDVLTALTTLIWVLTLWFVMPITVSHAAIYSCPTGNGDTAFQDRPCAQDIPIAPTRGNGSDGDEDESKSRFPMGMHPSWFISPVHAPQPAYCDRLGCDCASQARNFRNGLNAAVADAMFLEAAWHRYAKQVIEMETNPPKGISYLQLQVDIEESACDIQMSQLTLLNYAEGAFKDAEKQAKWAERRGNTDYSNCDGGNSLVCKDADAVYMYEQLLMDLETLRVPRNLFVADAD